LNILRRNVMLLLPTLLLITTACMPSRVPEPSPDNKAPMPANGSIEHPVRPNNIPDNFLSFTWIVEFEDAEGHLATWSADVGIHAISNAPVQGNVHGPYPFLIWTNTPYSHTMWYEPGIAINTDVYVLAKPEITLDMINKGIHATCSASNGTGEPVSNVVEDNQVDGNVAHCHIVIQ
jgi:hypothetical protein